MRMESQNARFLKQSVVERCRRMSPVQRVKAFIEHSKQMKGLRIAGELHRKAISNKKAGNVD